MSLARQRLAKGGGVSGEAKAGKVEVSLARQRLIGVGVSGEAKDGKVGRLWRDNGVKADKGSYPAAEPRGTVESWWPG